MIPMTLQAMGQVEREVFRAGPRLSQHSGRVGRELRSQTP